MKNRLQITLEDEAFNILNQQENKSQYIEELILKTSSADLATELKRLAMLMDGFVNDLNDIKVHIDFIKQNMSSNGAASALGVIEDTVLDMKDTAITKGSEFVPKPPDPETGYPCCLAKAPCRHWSFNGAEGYWENSLTGKTRDV